MAPLKRLAFLCAIVGLLHVGRYLAEYLHYRHCSSSLYALLFTHGSSTCVALRTFSTNMTANMATFCGLILNSMLASLAAAQALKFDTPPRLADQAPHM